MSDKMRDFLLLSIYCTDRGMKIFASPIHLQELFKLFSEMLLTCGQKPFFQLGFFPQ